MGRRSTPQPVTIPPPPGLRCARLRVHDDECLVLSYPVPEWTLPEALTPSEREIVRALLAGASRAEIAVARGTSRSTVSNLVASAYRKLEVNSRIELAGRLKGSTKVRS